MLALWIADSMMAAPPMQRRATDTVIHTMRFVAGCRGGIPLDSLAGKSERIHVSEVLGRIGDPRSAALARNFAEAFESFRSQCWDEAAMMFEALLHAYPRDGPSRYFLAWALRFRAAPEQAPAALISRVGKT